jgi:choline dehydrogenase-like flavoprotein
MLGCRCGAKWNAAEWVDDARAAGAELWTRAHVQRVVVQDGVARGVVGRRAGRPFRVHAERVVVAAGGIGSALLLRRSGFEEAGRGMAMDTTLMVYGDSAADGMGGDPPMTWSAPDDDLGVLYSTLIDPWLMYPIMLALKRPAAALGWHRWGRTLGVMIKVRDEVSGEVRPDGGLAKGLTRGERTRLEAAEEQAHRILLEAGCRKDTLISTPLRGTHPSATARLGTLVDTHLATRVPGLHVCDASVFPEALGRPTVLTILAFGERLAEHLLRAGRVG